MNSNQPKILNDYLENFINNHYSNNELYNHFNFLYENKNKMNKKELLAWEKQAENLYFTTDVKNISPDDIKKQPLIHNEYKNIFYAQIDIGNKTKSHDVKYWEPIIDDPKGFAYRIMITVIVNLFREPLQNQSKYVTRSNLINTFKNVYRINTKILIDTVYNEISKIEHKLPHLEPDGIIFKKFSLLVNQKRNSLIEIEKILNDNKRFNDTALALGWAIINTGLLIESKIRIQKGSHWTMNNIVTLNPNVIPEIMHELVQKFLPPLVIKPKNYKTYLKNKIYGGYLFFKIPEHFKENSNKNRITDYEEIIETEDDEDNEDDEDSNKINYEMNLNLIYNKISQLLIPKEGVSLKISNEYIENINYIQNIPIIINQDKLNNILNMTDNDLYNEHNINLKIINDKNLRENLNNPLYIAKIVEANIFLQKLYIAKIFSNIPIYMLWSSECRGRIFTKNWPLLFYDYELFRNLFELAEQDTPIKSIDATCSAYQIMGGLTFEYKVMEYTNVINSEERKDLYLYISNEMNKWILIEKNNLIKLYDIFRTKIKSNILAIYHIKTTLEIETLLTSFNRNTWKHYIMTWAYNKGLDSQIDTFLDEIILIPKSIYRSEAYPEIRKFVQLIIKQLRKIIKTNFPTIIILRSFFENYSAFKAIRNEPIEYDVYFSTHSVIQQYPQQKSTKVYLWSGKKENIINKDQNMTSVHRKIESIYTRSNTGYTCKRQSRVATMPNLIHYMDSILLMYVLSMCKYNKIPIITVHDCFYSNQKYLDKIKQFYTEAYIKYIIKYSPIDKLLNNLEATLQEIYSKDFKLLKDNDIICLITFINADLKIYNNKPIITTKHKFKQNIQGFNKLEPIFTLDQINKKIIDIIDFSINIDEYIIETKQEYIVERKKKLEYYISELISPWAPDISYKGPFTSADKKRYKTNINYTDLLYDYHLLRNLRANKSFKDLLINKIKNSKWILC